MKSNKGPNITWIPLQTSKHPIISLFLKISQHSTHPASHKNQPFSWIGGWRRNSQIISLTSLWRVNMKPNALKRVTPHRPHELPSPGECTTLFEHNRFYRLTHIGCTTVSLGLKIWQKIQQSKPNNEKHQSQLAKKLCCKYLKFWISSPQG